MKKKVAIAYDWIDTWGGVERVLLALHEQFSEADFFTSYYDSQKADWAYNLQIKTSFLQKFPEFIKKSRFLSLPFYPYAFESFDFSNYEIVISVTSSFAKGIITKPDTKHICYLLTPTRYIWGQSVQYFNNQRSKNVSLLFSSKLRNWDYIAAQRPDQIYSISELVAERCKKYYERNSKVVYPPFDTEYWNKIEEGLPKEEHQNSMKRPFYLVVSRLEPYKKIELVIEAFRALSERNVVIVGTGSLEKQLKEKAPKNVIYYSHISDRELAELYRTAKALIMPQEEDFGYTALEAQNFCCPVISYTPSGTQETVLEGITGMFFKEQTKEALCKTINKFEQISSGFQTANSVLWKEQVKKFDKSRFLAAFKV